MHFGLVVAALGLLRVAGDATCADGRERIPRRIIQTWKTSNPDGDFGVWSRGIAELHPSFEHTIFDDEAAEAFLAERLPRVHAAFSKVQHRSLRVQKWDLFRFAAVYELGGFYFDMDVELLAPLDDLLGHAAVFPHEEFIYPSLCRKQQEWGRWRPRDCGHEFRQIGQYAFGAEPRNPFVKRVLDGMVAELLGETGHAQGIRFADVFILSTTGPDYVSLVHERATAEELDGLPVLVPSSKSTEFPEQHGIPHFRFGDYGIHHASATWR